MSMSQKTGVTGSPERHEKKLIVVHDALDDEGGADHVEHLEPYESVEGGRYVMPAIRERIDQTRIQIEELGVITMRLPDDSGNPKAKYLDTIAQSALGGINQVYEAFRSGHKVLSLGGNHVRALDVIGAMRACHEMRIPFGLIWIDQHLDFNIPETSPSGNIHGMVSAVLQGRGAKKLLELLDGCPFVDPHNIIYIGPREDQMDGHETKDEHGNYEEGTEAYCFAQLIQRGAKCFTADSMKVNGKKVGHVSAEAKTAVKELSDRIQAKGGKLWTEWDVDVVDTKDMPAAVMKNDGGLSAAQMRDLFDFMEKNCIVDGMGVSEICPEKDVKGISRELIAEGVSKVLGISKEEAVQLAIKEPKKWRRVLDFVAGTAAGIAAIIGGQHLIKSPSVSPKATQVASISGEQYLNERRSMMYNFMKQDVRRQIEAYRLAQDSPHEHKEYVELLRKIGDAEALAPGKGDRSDMFQYLLSELSDVLGHQTGTKIFQRIIVQV